MSVPIFRINGTFSHLVEIFLVREINYSPLSAAVLCSSNAKKTFLLIIFSTKIISFTYHD